MAQLATMLWTELVTLLALVVYLGTLVYCGRMRSRHRIMAPATSGHPAYERAFRIQQNTLEQLVAFVPSLWLFSLLVNPRIGAILGAIWVLGRVVYAVSYARAPERRGPGFIVAFIVLIVLLAGALVKAVVTIAAVG
ncbi:MAG TPA: MAPEG family protein [Candidatus Sulfotelmatobacter sp.]|nr:MAPEG family protein [Candidatus Sulfotelmatobacter sp.]